MDFVFADMEKRVKEENQSVHIINIEIQDNHEDATLGAFIIHDICSLVSCLSMYTSLYLLWAYS